MSMIPHEKNVQIGEDGKRKPGRPRGSGRLQKIRAGKINMPIAEPGVITVLPVIVQYNRRIEELLKEGKVKLIKINGRSTSVTLKDGTVFLI